MKIVKDVYFKNNPERMWAKGLSVRAVGVLFSVNKNYDYESAKAMTHEQLLKLRNCGVKTANEIYAHLHE